MLSCGVTVFTVIERTSILGIVPAVPGVSPCRWPIRTKQVVTAK